MTTQAGAPNGDFPTRHATLDLDAAIAGRRSVRDYTAEPVPEETILELIGAAVHAPSASNGQPWFFTVVRDRALLDRLSDEVKAYLLATPGHERWRRSLEDPAYQVFHHAPALILVAATSTGGWAVEDCALAAENLMLAAWARGLGTCWIGFAQRYLETADGKRLLALPPDCVPVAPLVVGHPRTVPVPTDRREPEIRWIG